MQKGSISIRQLFILATGFTIATVIFLPPGVDVGNKIWVAIYLGAIEALLYVFVFTAIPLKFKNLELHDIFTKTYGKFLGSVVLLLFTAFNLQFGAFLLTHIIQFIKTTMLIRTPEIVIGSAILLACIYAAWCGLRTISRVIIPLYVIVIFTIIFTFVVMIKDMDIDNFKPFFEFNYVDILKTTHVASVYPYGESVIFLFIFPYVSNRKKIRKSMVYAILLTAFFSSIVVLRNIGVLGIRAQDAIYPSAIALRFINVADVITRLEVIVFLTLLNMTFVKLAVYLWCCAKGLGSVIKMRIKDLIVPLAIVMLFIASYSFENITDSYEHLNYLALYGPVFQLGLPLITLIVAKLRKKI